MSRSLLIFFDDAIYVIFAGSDAMPFRQIFADYRHCCRHTADYYAFITLY